ncbi:FAD-dependent oxidoreductase [Candidatus Kinetoplastidibacterium crithidiae]|uniref:FAD-dependent oxidoreductase n=1 Tax=Candidatus Kinetoplastidibacterium crithidiae TaxID=33056 RepID=UPI001CEF81A0|nr:FAD-dependent oxidoreductase [Candidatus Kinetoplastibacterium crithidii]
MSNILDINKELLLSYHVFIVGNKLPWKWQFKDRFTICQTSFNNGLDFLVTWETWKNDINRCSHLHYVVLESSSYCKTYLRNIYCNLPTKLLSYADSLLCKLPNYYPGIYRLEFEHCNLTLTLFLGVKHVLSKEIVARFNAYFLSHPTAEEREYFKKIVLNLSKLGAKESTISIIKRDDYILNILYEIGFKIYIENTSVRDLYRIVGVWSRIWSSEYSPLIRNNKKIVIIGAGLSGVGIAHALSIRGIESNIIDIDITGDSHIGHLGASLSPSISVDNNILSRLVRLGMEQAWSRWSNLMPKAFLDRCGSLQLDIKFKNDKIFDLINNDSLLSNLYRYVDRIEASNIAGIGVSSGGIFCKNSMVVSPRILINRILKLSKINVIQQFITKLDKKEDKWIIFGKDGKQLASADILILANSYNSLSLLNSIKSQHSLIDLFKARRVLGEVALIKDIDLQGGPNCILEGQCYILPSKNGYCIVGGTYLSDFRNDLLVKKSRLDNLSNLADSLNATHNIYHKHISYWHGERMVLPNRIPMIGNVVDNNNLFLAIGYASRGLCWSSLGGDIIASQICGEPLLIEKQMMTILKPR